MRVGAPLNLIALVLLPALLALFWWAHRQRRRKLHEFLSPGLAVRLTPSVSSRRRLLKEALLASGLLVMVLAAARPQWGYTWEQLNRKGIELVVLLDTSLSMLAQDASPSRLERAKLELKDLVTLLDGDQVALVPFAGEAFVLCPMTLDYRTVDLFLGGVSTDMVARPGTAIGAALKAALTLFRGANPDSKAILLITDGEENQNTNPIAMATEAAKVGVRIFSIGLGSGGAVPIPLDPQGVDLKKDPDGKLVATSLDENTLRELARITGGSYVKSASGELNVPALYKEIHDKTVPEELRGKRAQRWEDRYQGVVILAFVLLIVEALIDERRGSPLGRFRHVFERVEGLARGRLRRGERVAGGG
jgi:Ca-activated chloride channel family protein